MPSPGSLEFFSLSPDRVLQPEFPIYPATPHFPSELQALDLHLEMEWRPDSHSNPCRHFCAGYW